MHVFSKKPLSPTTNSDSALPSQPCHNLCNLPSHTSLQPHSCYAFMFSCQRLQNDVNIANSKEKNKHHLTNLAKTCYNKKIHSLTIFLSQTADQYHPFSKDLHLALGLAFFFLSKHHKPTAATSNRGLLLTVFILLCSPFSNLTWHWILAVKKTQENNAMPPTFIFLSLNSQDSSSKKALWQHMTNRYFH